MITAFHWQNLNSHGSPLIEIMAQHDSNWVAGQENHPHPSMSPDGKWICYNRGVSSGEFDPDDPEKEGIIKNIYGEPVGKSSRSDVFVVQVN
jgi:Tol biopolymer transport system component